VTAPDRDHHKSKPPTNEQHAIAGRAHPTLPLMSSDHADTSVCGISNGRHAAEGTRTTAHGGFATKSRKRSDERRREYSALKTNIDV